MKETNVYRLLQDIATEHVAQNVPMPESAVVTSIDLDNYTVMANPLYDPGLIVGPLRICSPYAGNGFGLTCMPQVGDEVLIVYASSLNDGFVVGRLYGPSDPPPSFNNGEYKITHASGSTLLLDVNGNIVFTAKNGAQTTIGQDGTLTTSNNKGSLALNPDGEVKFTNQNGSIDMNAAGQFALTGPGGVELLGLISSLINDMIQAAPSFATYPSGTLNAALLAQLTILSTQIQSISQ